MIRTILFLSAWWLIAAPNCGVADDFFLTIGGGYSPSGNQASLEHNVLFFQRALRDNDLDDPRSDLFFADGTSEEHDLQIMDPNSVPKANRLMAELFGSRTDLGLSYRNHRIPGVRDSTNPKNIRRWFRETGSQMKADDRLIIYVTAHGTRSGNRQDAFNTTIATWNNSSIRMTEFVQMLDTLPEGIEVVAVMVQCHAGGFARFIFKGGDPDQGLSPQRRCGFFATVHDRPAAGCTAEVDEISYVEYSTYFWAALSGRSRTGEAIKLPDYDGDGQVSFAEAHGYTILSADTIDLPVKSSGEFLTEYSRFANDDHPDLLENDESYKTILNLATPTQHAVLEGLSAQLELSGDNRIVDAWRATQGGNRRGGNRRRREPSPSEPLRRKISADLMQQWPELANVLNPVSIEFLTTRSDEFVEAVEKHPEYAQYRVLADRVSPEPAKRTVKYERFLRVVDNVALAENLKQLGDKQHIAQYNAIIAAESSRLKN